VGRKEYFKRTHNQKPKYLTDIHKLITTTIKLLGLSSQNLYLVNKFFSEKLLVSVSFQTFYAQEGSVTPANPSVYYIGLLQSTTFVEKFNKINNRNEK
jgi:hypothetical protein